MIIELNIADDTLGFVFENELEQSDVNEIKDAIQSKLTKYKKVSLYLEEDNVDEIKINAFIDHVFFDLSHADRIRKIAIVSNRKWIRAAAKIKDILMSSDVESFELKDRVDALCWVMKLSKV